MSLGQRTPSGSVRDAPHFSCAFERQSLSQTAFEGPMQLVEIQPFFRPDENQTPIPGAESSDCHTTRFQKTESQSFGRAPLANSCVPCPPCSSGGNTPYFSGIVERMQEDSYAALRFFADRTGENRPAPGPAALAYAPFWGSKPARFLFGLENSALGEGTCSTSCHDTLKGAGPRAASRPPKP